MPLLKWGKKYSVGVKAWDDEHAILVGILNDLHAAMMKGKAQSHTGPLLRKLLDYTQQHFATEERMMLVVNHPSLARQRELHQKLTAQVVEFCDRNKQGDTSMYLPLSMFLRDWLTDHILKEDMECGLWMSEHGVN